MKIAYFLLFGFVCVGCALPPALSRPAIGIRSQGDSTVPFASSDDLMTAGLVSEAMLLVNTNRFFDAEKRLRQAVYLEPASEQLRFNLGVVLNRVGQPEESRDILRALYEGRPDRPAYAVALADVSLTLGDRDEARRLLKAAFRRFKQAGNPEQAARIARSISNVDFEGGYEEEALCYSYEALALAPNGEQLGWHGRLLVALNMSSTASSLLVKHFKQDAALSRSPTAQHALALARYATGDFPGALSAEESALDLVDQAPDLAAELNAAWWLMKKKTLKEEEGKEIFERLDDMQSDVYDFAQRPNVLLTTWPPALRAELGRVVPGASS